MRSARSTSTGTVMGRRFTPARVRGINTLHAEVLTRSLRFTAKPGTSRLTIHHAGCCGKTLSWGCSTGT